MLLGGISVNVYNSGRRRRFWLSSEWLLFFICRTNPPQRTEASSMCTIQDGVGDAETSSAW